MSRLHSIAAVTYGLGWVSAIAAVIYRLIYSSGGGRISASTHILPHNLLQLSVLAFLVCIASEVRTVAMANTRSTAPLLGKLRSAEHDFESRTCPSVILWLGLGSFVQASMTRCTDP